MAAQPLAVQLGVAPACQALGVSRATCATPGTITLNASFAASRNPCRFPNRSGSTHLPYPHPQQERLLSQSQSPVSQSR